MTGVIKFRTPDGEWHEVRGAKGEPGLVQSVESTGSVALSVDEAGKLSASADIGFTSTQASIVNTKLSRLTSQRFDTRDYASVQSTIDAAHAAGGGEVFIGGATPSGLSLTLRDGVYLTGRGVGATTLNVNTITGTGSLTALPALASAVSQHSRTVTFATTPDLSPGDVFVLASTVDGSFNAARTYYRAGEFCRVASVSGTTVTLTAPTYASYVTGGTVVPRKLVPIRTGISGMTIRGTTGQTVIRVDLGSELVFRDLSLSGSNQSHLTLSRCYNVQLGDVSAFDAQPATAPGLNYGVCLLNCQRIRISGVDLETRRHGLTVGGDSAIASVPSRDIIVTDSRISGMSDVAGVCGCNLHGNCEDIHLTGVSMPAGFNPGGDMVTVRNCEIGSAAWGGCIGAMEMLGTSMTFENNVIRPTANHPSDRGAAYFPLTATATRGGGIMRFANNLFDLGAYGGSGATTHALSILVTDDSVPATNEMELRDNTFRTDGTVTANHYGARIRTQSTSSGFISVRVIDNLGNLPVVVPSGMGLYYEGRGFGAPTMAAIRGSRYLRIDGGAGSTLYIKETDGNSSVWRDV